MVSLLPHHYLASAESVCVYVSVIDQVQENQNPVFMSGKCGRLIERPLCISEKISFIKITTRSTSVSQ